MTRYVLGLAALALVVACGEDEQGAGADAAADAVDILIPGDISTGAADTVGGDSALAQGDSAGAADATPPDTAVTDTGGEISPGAFGASCNTNGDCLDGWCVEGPEGFICTKECQEVCPTGFDCKGIASLTDVVFLCVPRLLRLCTPCLDDLQCTGGACLSLDDERRSCAAACAGAEDCPEGYECGAAPGGDPEGTWCLPESGSCTCNVDVDGGLRTCAATGALGTCYGVEACEPLVGWGACSVEAPVAETCDGIDNDCNGLVDDGLDDEGGACDISVAGVGSCAGVLRCTGAGGWVCQGPTPSEEICDFQDNNCDGQVDEPFKTGDAYTDFEHCGTCNASCGVGFPGAAQTHCQAGGSVPQCVVVSCEDGFIKLNDFQCIPDVVNLCQPCASDDNCIGQDSACVSLDDGQFCGKGCAVAADCPLGFDCEEVGEPTKQCVPSSGVCSCGPETLGLSRACSVTVSPPGQPSYTCAGAESCGASGWGECALPSEECDGFDNDCDGDIDEDFRDSEGRYDQVANCGGCGLSCLALSFEHAQPICDASGGGAPQCGYTCSGAWVDIDDLPGCECLPSSSVDYPDPLGDDADCDGVDGELDKAIFVAKTGSDSASGGVDDPVRTVQRGIDRAVSLGKRDVYVATGVYMESILLADGVRVYGGYSPSFRERDVQVHEAALIGATPTAARPGTVNAVGVGHSGGAPSGIDGFTIFGANSVTSGGSSYAVYLKDVGPHLSITRDLIIAGDGGPGTRGGDGVAGADGASGGPGLIGKDVGSSCDASEHNPGGLKGVQSCGGVNTSGGWSGDAICPDPPDAVQTEPQYPEYTEYGGDGANNPPGEGEGGEPGWDGLLGYSKCGTCSSSSSHPGDGAIGENGHSGTDGAAAAACADGAGEVVGGLWEALPAGDGGAGVHGGGGGGGGAGGGIDRKSSCTTVHVAVGGSGGGGGAGGCAGTGGEAGLGGGGSFGVFLTWSSSPSALPTVDDNSIVRGRGGAGGAGGAGGPGGAGGYGGPGGLSGESTSNVMPLLYCGNAGGAGGDGGGGGQGAGGAGGCGGVAYGLYIDPIAAGVSTAPLSGNAFPASGAGGAGGQGGQSYGQPGPAGVMGVNAAKSF